MKNRKGKILLSVILSIAVALSSNVLIYAEETSSNLSSTTTATKVLVGDTFDVTIDLRNDTKLISFAGGISFDKSKVRVVGYKGNVKWHNNDVRLNRTDGTYVEMSEARVSDNEDAFGMWYVGGSPKPTDPDYYIYASGNLVTITFEAIALGDANIELYEDTDGPEGKSVSNVNPGYTVSVVSTCSHNIEQVIGKDYYHCTICNKYFSDPAGTQPIEIVGQKANLKRLFEGVGENEGLRLAGSTRIQTSIESANKLKAVLNVDKFDTAIITNAWNYPDALAGGYLSSVRNNAPILLTDSGNNVNIVQFIEDNVSKGSEVYILGNWKSVDTTVDDMLRNAGYVPTRLAGDNRIDTSIKIVDEAGLDQADTLLVCNAWNFADSLPASALGFPIMLVQNEELTSTQIDCLQGKKFDHIYILGGTGSVKAAYETIMYNYLSDSGKVYGVQRLAGKSRVETSTIIAATLVPDATALTLVYAWEYPDGLSAGPIAKATGMPVVLTSSNAGEIATVRNYVIAHPGITKVSVLGGDSDKRITTAAYKQIMGW